MNRSFTDVSATVGTGGESMRKLSVGWMGRSRMRTLRAFAALVVCSMGTSLAPAVAGAVPVGIIGYDVINADVSGTFGWAHVYTGLITPISASLASYTGIGTGTLADDVLTGTTALTTELFVTSPSTVVITLFLDDFYTIDQIDLLGGDHGATNNGIPGMIFGMSVTINATQQAFATTGFGPPNIFMSSVGINDRVTITGSPLDGLVTNQISVSNVMSTSDAFSIAEIQITGTPVPEPSTALLLASGLLAMAVGRRRCGL